VLRTPKMLFRKKRAKNRFLEKSVPKIRGVINNVPKVRM
jgi:hypothetical protein